MRAAIPLISACFSLGLAPAAQALISLTASPVILSGLAPGGTATGSGTLTATDTSGNWTLQAQDSGTGAGHMVAGSTGCTGSSSELVNPLQLNITSTLAGVASAGTVSLTGANQTVASATNQILAGSILTSNFTQVVPTSQVMRVGCVYSITVTFTLQ